MKTRILAALVAALVLASVASAQLSLYGNVPDSATRVYDSNGKALPFSIGASSFSFITGTTITIPSGLTIAYAAGTFDLAIAATDQFLVDANTTNHTGTDPVFEIDMESSTADNVGFGLGLTITNGAASGTDIYLGQWTATVNDADADFKGIHYTAASTANAGAGSYESFFTFDCAEATAGACVDGLLFTSSGASTALTDAIDVSAANIANGINLGGNTLLMAAGVIAADSLTVDTTDDMTITVTSSTDAEDLNIAQSGANDSSILLTAAGTGVDAIGLTAAAGTVKVAGDILDIDTTGDSNFTVTSSGAGEDMIFTQSGANDSSITFTAAGTGVDAISLAAAAGTVKVAGDKLDVDSTDDMDITVTSSTGGEDILINQVGANDSSITLTAAGTGADAVGIHAAAGGLDIDAGLNVDIDATGDATLNGGPGAEATAGNVCSEACVGAICQTSCTLTAVAVTILNTTGPGHNCFGGVQLYDFPAGWINRLGVVATFSHILAGAGGLADAWDGDIGFGSVTAVEDGGLASTEVDWVPTTSLPQAAAGDVTTGIANSTVTEQTICDGHSTACDLFMNFEADDADCSAADTLAVTGTVKVTWINLGDN
jgi:hypothetical protein